MKHTSKYALFLAFISLIALSSHSVRAGNATWNLNPVTAEWNNTANWTPGTVPTVDDIATFAISNTTGISVAVNAGASGIIFADGASAFTIGVGNPGVLTIGPHSITNNSGIKQNFLAGVDAADNQGGILFTLTGSAGSQIVFTTTSNPFGDKDGGFVQFLDTSSADNAGFINEGGTVSGSTGGVTDFFNQSTAANALITAEGGVVGGAGGGLIKFELGSNAGNATLIARGGIGGGSGGKILLLDFSKTATARAEVFGNGNLDISGHTGAATIGSVEGDGQVLLGAKTLIVGANNLSTTFAGVIQNTGSLSKTGSGAFTLSGANNYTGTTTISAGALLASNGTGSATSAGSVKVNAGTLGGSGTIAGAVTVGTGGGGGAFLAPAFGSRTQVTLTLQSSLTLQADATYTYTFKANKNKARTDLVLANGVTINNAALAITGTTQGRMKRGTVLTVISNTSANPISGTFSNLADGAIITVNGNNLQASYEGGDGNDLTLTVVP